MRLPRLLDASLYSICIVVLIAALVDLRWTHWVEPVDWVLADELARLRAPSIKPDPDIVIVDIDEHSLEAMDPVGRFPWPRYVYGEVVEEFRKQGAKAIVFDIELYEPDQQRPDSDAALQDAVLKTTNSFFPIQLLDRLNEVEGRKLGEIGDLLAFGKAPDADPNVIVPMELPNVIDYKRDPGAWGRTGFINFNVDSDGIGRRYWLRQTFAGWEIPSLPTRVARAFGWKVPAGDALPLTWSAGARPHAQVSFSDLYFDIQNEKRKRPPDEFRNKIVLIGASATYLRDIKTTPIAAARYPGVEILATAIDNLKNGRNLVIARDAWRYLSVFALFVPLLYALKRRANLVRILGVLFVATLGIVGAAYAALIGYNVLILIGTPLVFAWVFFLLASLRAYLKEQRAKEQRELVLSRFLDRRLVKQLVAEGVKLEDFKSETRTITVLFSDIRGFTALSETKPAEEIVAMLNRYLSQQAETVFRHGGTLDKFIGDAIMAFWNAPTDDAKHAEHAVACALEMVETLMRFNGELAQSGVAPLDIGVGINTGPAVVGFVGSQRKLEYTAIGDTVNLASRIEGETKGRTRVLVTSTTRQAIGDTFRFVDWGSLSVKGRAAQVNVYSPEVLV
jgi:adenylate cyclase